MPWLAGYDGSKPALVGNAASTQFQLDVCGDVSEALHHARMRGLKPTVGWAPERPLVCFVEAAWERADS